MVGEKGYPSGGYKGIEGIVASPFPPFAMLEGWVKQGQFHNFLVKNFNYGDARFSIQCDVKQPNFASKFSHERAT